MAKRKAFGISKALNEGISQTINAARNNAGQLRYEVIPLSKIKFDPHNPRKLSIKPEELLSELDSVDPSYEQKRKELDSLKSLATSIKKSGVRNAIEVYKDGTDYRLISGERRVLGSILAGKEDVQARILDTKPTEFDIRYLQWIENIEREDLSIWERVQNVKQLITAFTELNHQEVTATTLKEILGCSLPHAMTYMAVLNAPADIQELVQQHAITNLEKAAFLAKIDSAPLRARLVKSCLEDNLSLASLKKQLQDKNKLEQELKAMTRATPRGRVAKRVTLGYTENIKVARYLIDLIVAQGQYHEVSQRLTQIDWQDYASVSRGFQLLIKLMEQSILDLE